LNEVFLNLDLPQIERSTINFSEKTLNYQLNNFSFLSLKVPLCLRIDISNQTNRCERVVTSSGIIKLDENDLNHIHNVSICLDHYEDYCGKSLPVEMSMKNKIFFLSSNSFFFYRT
jgi:hypothetical protein